ncbi:AraC family transcriptional regulator [Paenibacillus silvisoli]|uniref:AraC family transcriptional regulator n=1 Tax=Paenibacillus silvisoli TaxID=3110539 RepID=UPI002804832B|nr:AraC family transcriptional regulator [Paenibacillus silvisoli]
MQHLIDSMKIESCIAGTVVYPPGGTYGPRLYREIQLFLLHTGTVVVEVDGVEYEMVPGQMTLLTPDREVYFDFDKSESSSHSWITVDPISGLEPALLQELECLPRLMPISEQMNRLVDLSVVQQKEAVPEHLEVVKSLARAALQLYAAESVNSAAAFANLIIHAAKTFIAENYAESLTLQDLADEVRISQSQLVRLFRLHERMAPIAYLWRYRVSRGINLLRTTGLSVGEVSERCGFKSSYHFSRQIKRHTRRTPTEIRSSYWRADVRLNEMKEE